MAYQVLRDFYLMGPAGRLAPAQGRFAMTRGFIFDVQSRYRRFFDVFVETGDLRLVNARPTHVFRNGDFRPIKSWPGEEFEEAPGVRRMMDDMGEKRPKDRRGLPRPLQEMSPWWLGKQNKKTLLTIAKRIGIQVDADDEYTNDQIRNMIVHQKELEALGPMPDAKRPQGPPVVDEKAGAPGMVQWGAEDKV